MPNQDRLHEWWWSENGPQKAGPSTINDVSIMLDTAKIAGVARGRTPTGISQSGWNYAVLKFLIEYCVISPPNQNIRADLVAYAHPKTENYNSWRRHGAVEVTINSLMTLKTPGVSRKHKK
jgi:hypothetical protein